MLTQYVQIVTNQSVGWCLAQVLGNQPSKGDSNEQSRIISWSKVELAVEVEVEVQVDVEVEV